MSKESKPLDYERSGWDSLDWDHIVEADEAMKDAAADLGHAVNGGGGSFGPERLRAIATKIESVAAELRAVCDRYL
ncbi:MAG: hypothetical protein RJA36_966 [Pseudomonadota bacterium]|jgi:HPt (histidine-containing phosphotransfer) domain-containing protein